MEVLFLIVPLTMVFSFASVMLFVKAVLAKQFDDPDGAAILVFADATPALEARLPCETVPNLK